MAKFFTLAMAFVFGVTFNGMTSVQAAGPSPDQSPTVIAEGKSGEEHGKAGESHGKAGEDHGKAGEDHGKAGDDQGKSKEKGKKKAKGKKAS